MMRWLHLFALLIMLPITAVAQQFPAPLGDKVSDFAAILPPDAVDRIDAILQQGRDETGVHVVVVTLDTATLPDAAAQPLPQLAKALFNQWGIGDKERNDGVLILVAPDRREVRIALGSGYDAVWDNAAQRVIDRHMLPAFRDDRMADGVEAGATAAYDLIARPFAARLPPPEEPTDWTGYAFGAGIVALFLGIGLRGPLSGLLLRIRACPSCGARQLSRHDTTTGVPTGQILTVTRCGSCGHEDRSTRPIRSGRSGGGSSGFGGGRSSGGGASGKW